MYGYKVDQFKRMYDTGAIRIVLYRDELDAFRTHVGVFFDARLRCTVFSWERADRLKNIYSRLEKKWLSCFLKRNQAKATITLPLADAICLWQYLQEIPCHTLSTLGLAAGKLDQALQSCMLYVRSKEFQNQL